MIPQIIPLTSDTPRLRQPVSRSPVARRRANALSTKAAGIPMALVGHSCGTLLQDTLVGHSCRTLLRDTLVGHSCGSLL